LIERQWGDICYLQFNHYLQFSDITHGIFTRLGGHSQAPYWALNTSTSLKVGDSVANVIRNRQLTLQALERTAYPCATLWQVHGADIVTFNNEDEWRTDWAHYSYYEQSWMPQSLHKADAIITQQRGIALALSFADCVPIVLYDPVVQAIGLAHGGWRGTARGIVAATVEAMCLQFGCHPHNIYAGIGPSIGACCYEVSDSVQDLFLGRSSFDDMPTREQYRGLVRDSAVFSTVHLPAKVSLRLNLWETNRNQLLGAGLMAEHIEVAEICTSCNIDRFFSHRGEHGKTGRFPVIVALDK